MPDEFGLIARIQAATSTLPTLTGTLPVSGDDCAVFSLPADKELAVSSDIYVVDVHFPADLAPADIARHCISAALSDLAATGALPMAMTLMVSAEQDSWVEALLPGCVDVAKRYKVSLIGGDLSMGRACLGVTVLGQVAPGKALSRAGAMPHEDIWLSGYTGEAAAGLQLLTASDRSALSAQDERHLVARFCRPDVRIDLGRALVGLASAAIDISDGLVADLSHVLKASQLGAEIFPENIHASAALQAFCVGSEAKARTLSLYGGDDYELCFTAPIQHRSRINDIGNSLGIELRCIGITRKKPGLEWPAGFVAEKNTGYRHFAP